MARSGAQVVDPMASAPSKSGNESDSTFMNSCIYCPVFYCGNYIIQDAAISTQKLSGNFFRLNTAYEMYTLL